jgi:hypothetical protein
MECNNSSLFIGRYTHIRFFFMAFHKNFGNSKKCAYHKNIRRIEILLWNHTRRLTNLNVVQLSRGEGEQYNTSACQVATSSLVSYFLFLGPYKSLLLYKFQDFKCKGINRIIDLDTHHSPHFCCIFLNFLRWSSNHVRITNHNQFAGPKCLETLNVRRLLHGWPQTPTIDITINFP